MGHSRDSFTAWLSRFIICIWIIFCSEVGSICNWEPNCLGAWSFWHRQDFNSIEIGKKTAEVLPVSVCGFPKNQRDCSKKIEMKVFLKLLPLQHNSETGWRSGSEHFPFVHAGACMSMRTPLPCPPSPQQWTWLWWDEMVPPGTSLLLRLWQKEEIFSNWLRAIPAVASSCKKIRPGNLTFRTWALDPQLLFVLMGKAGHEPHPL